LQHAFSTTVETVTTMSGQPLKFGGGDPDWRRFFSLMGSVIAQRERTPHVPNTPVDPVDLRRELRGLARKLRVKRRLETWRDALRRLPTKRSSRAREYLLILDPRKRTVQGWAFKSADEASKQYLLFEKDIIREKGALDVVRSSSSFESTKSGSWQWPTPNVGPGTGSAASDGDGTACASGDTPFRRHPGATPLGLIRPK
jgi:hypothetical protein